MFETTQEILGQIGIFAAIGFCLGFGYDILRFFRILFGKGQGRTNIGDLLYLPFCAFVIFCCIVEYGGGKLRLYFFFAALLGAGIYLVTLGNLTKLAAKWFRSLILFIFRQIKKPIYSFYCLILQFFRKIFGSLCQKIGEGAKKASLHLKNTVKIVYNKNNSKMGKLYETGGEERHVIKAEVRKKA